MQDILPLKQTVCRRLDSFCRELNLFRAFVFHDWDVNFTGQVLAVKLETFGHFAIFTHFTWGNLFQFDCQQYFRRMGWFHRWYLNSIGPHEVLSLSRNSRDAFEIWRACTWRPPGKPEFCCGCCWSKVLLGWLVGWLKFVGCCLICCWLRLGGGHLMKWWSWNNPTPWPALCILLYLALQKSVVWLKRKRPAVR